METEKEDDKKCECGHSLNRTMQYGNCPIIDKDNYPLFV